MSKLLSAAFLMLTAMISVAGTAMAGDAKVRPRIIATTDGEVDDRCSMVRFLLSANEWDIQGIIHSSSTFHWAGDENHKEKSWEPVEWLDRQIDQYEEVYPKLKQHDDAFPTPDYLRSMVFVGNIGYEGDMEKPTAGSQRIVEVLLQPDTSPIWLQAWGGANTIARALKTIKDEHPDRVEEVSKKAKLFLIAEQDKTLREYIRPEWPGVEVLLSDWPSFEVIAYPWEKYLTKEQQKYFDKDWMKANILEGHGPLCADYESSKNGKFRSEGDTPAFLHVIDNGLRSFEHPSYGGWGGRFKKKDGFWISDDKRNDPPHTIGRWSIDFQNDWAARADWCVKDYADANHPPVAALAHEENIEAKAGERLTLDASKSTDPDGDELNYDWWLFKEAGTKKVNAELDQADGPREFLIIPEDAEVGGTVHAICVVRDSGEPVLTRYARVIVTIVE